MAYTPNRVGIKELSQRFPFYNRSMMTDDIANDILGFDNAMTPWAPANIPGGAGNWTATIGAGSIMDTITIPHFMLMKGNNGAATYLQWTNAAAKTLLYFNASVGIRQPVGGNSVVFEIRCWDSQAPGAATKYYAARWETFNGALTFGWYYGTGITFAYSNGTAIGIHAWYPGAGFNGIIQTAATPACSGWMYRSEGSLAMDTYLANASMIASFKTVWFYMSASLYNTIVLDDVQVA